MVHNTPLPPTQYFENNMKDTPSPYVGCGEREGTAQAQFLATPEILLNRLQNFIKNEAKIFFKLLLLLFYSQVNSHNLF